MNIQAFFNSDGTSVTAVITIIVDGVHTDPDSWPITNDPAIVLSTHPSAAKTVTKIDTGVYQVTWTGLSPALTHGQLVYVSVDGEISTEAWSTDVRPIQVVHLPAKSSDVPTTTANANQLLDFLLAMSAQEAATYGDAQENPLGTIIANMRLVRSASQDTAAETAQTSAIITGIGGTGFDVAEHGLKPISDKVDALDPATLTGPHTLTVTVTDDDDDPIEGASVRVHRTGHSETKLTDADGEVTFTVGEATWTVSVTASGYNGDSESVVVDGNAAVTVALTPQAGTPAPDDPTLCLVAVHVMSNLGAMQDKAKVSIDDNDQSANTFTATSIIVDGETEKYTADGVAEFTLIRGVTYKITVSKYGRSKTFSYLVPDSPTAIATEVI